MELSEILTRIGRSIKKTREDRKISQQDLAAKCNFEKSNMSRIEAGRTNLTIGTLHKISAALGIKITDLLTGM